MVWFQSVSRKMPLSMSAPPARTRNASATPMSGARPKPVMASPQSARGQGDRAAVPADPAGPAAHGRRGERAGRRGRVHQAHRPRRVQLGRHEREQRVRERERHRRDVHQVGADELGAPARVPQPVRHAAQPARAGRDARRPGRGRGRGQPAEPAQEHERDREADRVQDVDRPRAGQRGERPAESGARDDAGVRRTGTAGPTPRSAGHGPRPGAPTRPARAAAARPAPS